MDLTYVYYAKKLLAHLKHYYLRIVWKIFATRPIKQQLLEEVLIFFAQWMQPEKDISRSKTITELDDISQEVMEHLKIKYPRHPIFLISSEQFSYWRYNNIDEDQWYFEDGKPIIDSLCEVLYKKNYFVRSIQEMFSFEKGHLINYVSYKTICYNYGMLQYGFIFTVTVVYII